MHSPHYYLTVALICTALWLWMGQNRVASRIRNSRAWPLGWLAHLYLGGTAVCCWFALASTI